MRSALIDLDYWLTTCQKVFPEISQLSPDVSGSNINFGSVNLKSSNIMFTNGVEDIWKDVSILEKPEGSDLDVLVIDCDDCAHCVDLYDEKDEDAEALKQARVQIREFFNRVLQTE